MNTQSPDTTVRPAAVPPTPGHTLTATAYTPTQALAYYRVSTTEQANTSYDEDGFSIQAQREYCHRKAAELGTSIGDGNEYIDRGKSARTADRPELRRMLKRVAEDPDITYVIVHKLDRLARNREDDVQIGIMLAKHGVRLVSATENIDETPGGKLVHGIMASIAEWYSGNLSQEAQKGLRKKVEIGGTPGKAPLGYRNIRDKRKGKDIGLVTMDEILGPLITQAFSLYATGLYTLSALTDELNHLGLRMPETRSLSERPVQIQHVHRILRNSYYTGVITYNGVMYQGEHNPLVDEVTFEMVQAILTSRNLNKDKSKKRPHPLKGNLFCARCGRRLGITSPTNRHGTTYAYFYCLGRQNDKTSCKQVYVSVEELEVAVANHFRHVRIPQTRLQQLRDEIIHAFEGKHADGAAEITAQQQRIKKLHHRAKKNKEAYFADALSLDEFKTEQDKTREEIAAAEKTIAKLTVTLESIRQSLDDALSILTDPYRFFIEAPDPIKLMLTQAIFDKLWVMDHDVVGSELTDAYHELLTMEARLTLDEQATAEPNPDGLSLAPTARTYYRRRADGSDDLSDEAERADLARRLWIERPRGALPLDSRNPAPHDVRRGSDVNHLVELLTAYSHSAQAADLRLCHTAAFIGPVRAPRPSANRPWSLRDRLTERDTNELITAYREGATAASLAAAHDLSLRSVKRLLHTAGVRRIPTDSTSYKGNVGRDASVALLMPGGIVTGPTPPRG